MTINEKTGRPNEMWSVLLSYGIISIGTAVLTYVATKDHKMSGLVGLVCATLHRFAEAPLADYLENAGNV